MSSIELIYGQEFAHYLKDLTILIVGVGGIGCELLKVLCTMELKAIHLV